MAASKQLADRLHAVPLFSELTRKELDAVLRSADEVSHPAGKPIVREGSTGAGFHLVLEGEATVSQGDRELRRLRPGDYFGEIALIDGGTRSATVTTATPVRTLSIASWNFRPLLGEYPSLSEKLLVALCRRIRDLEGPAHT